ncbi:MAG: PTH1 family peptidyl-tRNA hydrolase [Cellvibrionaceae bacterium]|jgi:PTH1 family peptidyl-tRNA hydrolase
MNMPISLIVGLGNPGAEYHGTRHNVGADFTEALARRQGVRLMAESKFHGLCGRILLNDRPIRLLIPTTFMNLSGRAVAAMADFYKISPDSILVVHDELDLSSDTVRLKIGGGHGGHNGLRDIIKSLNNKNFPRLRIGIDHPGNANRVSAYVLSKPSIDQRASIDCGTSRAFDILPQLTSGEWDQAMKTLHTQ